MKTSVYLAIIAMTAQIILEDLNVHVETVIITRLHLEHAMVS